MAGASVRLRQRHGRRSRSRNHSRKPLTGRLRVVSKPAGAKPDAKADDLAKSWRSASKVAYYH
jgi:hypothetical protein